MRLLRTKQVVQLTGLSRMTIYRLEKSGTFPARRQLGQNSVAWLEDDVAAWVGTRPQPARGLQVAEGPPLAMPSTILRREAMPRGRRIEAQRPPRRPVAQVDLPLDEPSGN